MSNDEIKNYLDEIKKHLESDNKFKEIKAFNLACELYNKSRAEGIKIGMENSIHLIKTRIDIL